MTARRYGWLGWLLVLGSVLVMASIKGPGEQAKETIDAVIDTLRNESLELSEKRDKVKSLIEERFDFREMSKWTLARSWRQASPEEKERFVELFKEQLGNTYLSAIKEYQNETVSVVREKIRDDQKYAQVDTVIHGPNQEIPVDYKLYLKGDEWQVYDVVIEGVSLIRNYRSSYQSIIRRQGISGLLAQMEEKLKGEGQD